MKFSIVLRRTVVQETTTEVEAASVTDAMNLAESNAEIPGAVDKWTLQSNDWKVVKVTTNKE